MPDSFDLLITGAQVVTGATIGPATLAVAGGRIVAILGLASRPPAAEVIDASGLHLLPGLIDTHVHTRHPGIAEREDFRSGTAAAAAGGITTLFEMPIAKVPANSASGVQRRVAAMTPEAHIDFALYGGAGHENLHDIAGQAAAGVVAFKTFLQPPPPIRLDEFFGLWCTDHAALRGVMAAVAATGLRHCFHCEDTPMFQALQAQLAEAGRRRGRAHAESRPPIVEEVSVALVLTLAAESGGPVGVVHCSSARSAQLVADARARGIDATVETCPPYCSSRTRRSTALARLPSATRRCARPRACRRCGVRSMPVTSTTSAPITPRFSRTRRPQPPTTSSRRRRVYAALR